MWLVARLFGGFGPPPADRLVTACCNGDLPSVKAAVADGASVNEKGRDTNHRTGVPLVAAMESGHDDIVVWLLAHGADPNGADVMSCGVTYGAGASGGLQLLIDAGGSVNRVSGHWPPLYSAVFWKHDAAVQLLLAHPSLDLTFVLGGQTPEQFARECRYGNRSTLADMMSMEVSGCVMSCSWLWRAAPLLLLSLLMNR